MKTLRIAKDLEFPLDAVTQKLAFLGRTGSGKTYGAKRMVEQMLHAGAQVVILDPVGVWPGLRLGPKSFDVPVLGGLFGDIPLEPTAGALIADLIVDHMTSMVLDVSQMRDAERTRFATAFGERFFQRKKEAPSAVHLVLEECQEFVPQNPQPGEQMMLHEFQRIVKLGRNFGIGVSCISQRPQEVAKKALNQSECVFAFQMTGPQERKALEYWLSDKGFDEKLSDILPRLAIGAPHVWSPQWLNISKVVKILPIDTLDTSSTPKVGDVPFEQKKLKPIDLKALQSAMSETVEATKQNDPKALRARVAELEAELAAKPKPEPTLSDALLGRLEAVVEDLQRVALCAAEVARDVIGALPTAPHSSQIRPAKGVHQGQVPASATKNVRELSPDLPKDSPGAPKRARKASPSVGTAGERDAAVGKGALMRMLSALAQAAPATLSRKDLAIRAGVVYGTGHFTNSLTQGRGAGWIAAGSDLAITPAGIAALGKYEPRPTGRGILKWWLAELGESAAARMLTALAEAYPKPLTRAELGERANVAVGTGHFTNSLSQLRKLSLVEKGTEPKATKELFGGTR